MIVEDLQAENASPDSPQDVNVRQLNVDVLLASLLEEKCLSLEADEIRGGKLFRDLCMHLSTNGVLDPQSFQNKDSMYQQKMKLNEVIQGLMKTELVPKTRYITDFEQIERLGKGGFGTVFKVKHKLDRKNYAVKKIRLKESSARKHLGEVRALAWLKHKNILAYNTAWIEDESSVSIGTGSSSNSEDWEDDSFDSTESTSDNVRNRHPGADKQNKKLLCIQTELCNCTLEDWLRDRNEQLKHVSTIIAVQELRPAIKRIFRQIFNGLNYVHRRGLVHRDLKPQNIFLTGRGRDLHVKIGDFGLVKAVKGTGSLLSSPTDEGLPLWTTENTRDIGSLLYGPPELLKAESCHFKSDMYSLGVILFEMFNIFTTDSERCKNILELRENNRCPQMLKSILPEEIEIIEKLISPEINDRPTAHDLLKHPVFAYDMQTSQRLQQKHKRSPPLQTLEDNLGYKLKSMHLNQAPRRKRHRSGKKASSGVKGTTDETSTNQVEALGKGDGCIITEK